MFSVNANKYKSLLKKLNEQISELTSKYCISNEYGYCFNISKLKRLNYIKDLLINNFVRKKLDKSFYCKEVKDGKVIEKFFNKIVNNKIEILVKKSIEKILEDKRMEIPFPTSYPVKGIWAGNYFIPINLDSNLDLTLVKDYLNKNELFSFFNYDLDYGKKIIFSCKRKVKEETICYEYQDIDKYCSECLDDNKLKKLIEDVC